MPELPGPSPEQLDKQAVVDPQAAEKQAERIVEINELFDAPGAIWGLTGGAMFSVRSGEISRLHKDIDIFVDQNSLQAIENRLSEKGYELILAYQDPENPKIETHEDFSLTAFRERGGTIIVAKKSPTHDKTEKDFLRHIDVFIIKRNEKDQRIDDSGTPLPDEWFEQQRVTFRGHSIPVEHPAKTIYYRLTSGKDFGEIKGYVATAGVSQSDIGTIEQLVMARMDRQVERLTATAERLSRKIANASDKEIYRELTADKTFRRRVIQVRKRLEEVVKLIAREPDRSPQAILRSFYAVWDPQVQRGQLLEKIRTLKGIAVKS